VIELSVLSPREHADTVSDALMELEALSASVEDADADTPDEVPQFGEPGMISDSDPRGSAQWCGRCSPMNKQPPKPPRCC
jgi:ribosomal protein L11 methylase PrmA